MNSKRQLVQAAMIVSLVLAAASVHAGDTTIGGKFYGDFSYRELKDATGQKTNGTGLGLDVKRFYVTVNHDLDDVWSLNFTSDIGDQNGAYDVFVKKAYLQAKLPDTQIRCRIGAADMPWIPKVEDEYGLRYVENVLVDRLHFGNSADWGLHVLGTTNDGHFNFQGSIVNGGGYKHPARSKTVDFAGRVGVTPAAGLDLAVGGYVGKLGQVQESTPESQNASRLDVMATYSKSSVKVGAEAFQAEKWQQVTTSTSDKAQGFSGWASVAVAPTWTVFGRFDWAKPSKDLDPDYKDLYVDAGVQLAAAKGLVVAPVVKWEKTQQSITAGRNGKAVEFGVYGQAKF